MSDFEPVAVDDYAIWGRLVKSWATGRSYFEDDAAPIAIERLPIPRSLQELKDQIALVGAGVHIPDTINGLTIVSHSADTMVLKLPPKERIEAQERKLTAPGDADSYPFPDFYAEFIDGNLSTADKLRAHACRIGDYTISMCG